MIRRGYTGRGPGKLTAATEEKAADGAEPELIGSDSKSEADTPEGTACGTGEEASLVESGSS